jgi:PDZ domain-containing secreted protein
VAICDQNEEKPQDLQELFSSKKSGSSLTFSVVFTKEKMVGLVKKHFKTMKNLYNFIHVNLKDDSKVIITKDEVKLSLPS